MNDKVLDWAVRIQAIAQAGLTYGKDVYDKERYEQLRAIAAEMVAEKTELSVDRIQDLFCNEEGYQTPKVDTRGLFFGTEKFCWYMKITEHGRCRAVGVTWISQLLPM